MSRMELIAHPLTIWLAPVGTDFPDLDADPTGAWQLLGKSGDRNFTEDGVTVTLSQSIETFTPAGGTMARKAWRTESGVIVGVTVADVRADIMKFALNGNTDVSLAGETSVSLLRGIDVTEYALLARGQSPLDNDAAGQFQVPRCVVDGEPEIQWTKGGDPAAIEFDFMALEPDDDDVDDFVWIYEEAAGS